MYINKELEKKYKHFCLEIIEQKGRASSCTLCYSVRRITENGNVPSIFCSHNMLFKSTHTMENKFLIQIFLKGKYVLKVGLWYPVWAHKQIFLQKITREIGKYVPKVGSGLV
jgi:hypothetical protein